MEAEASPFETSEMLARFLGSTPMLTESWKLCARSNVMAPQGFLIDEVGGVTYVAFSGVQSLDGLEPCCGNLVPLSVASAGASPVYGGGDGGMFSALQIQSGESVEMVDAGLLQLFLTIYHTPVFQNQMFEIKKKQKPVVFAGHSMGGAIAAMSSLWLLSYYQSISSPPSVICFTYGSPLIGNESLSRSIHRQRWGGNFCHVVSKFDIMPRLLLAPLAPITAHLNTLLKSWHLMMNSPFFIRDLGVQLTEHERSELFHFVLLYVDAAARSPKVVTNSFVPFGNFMFCSGDGAVCVDDTVAIVRMLHLTFASGSPSSSINDHLQYESYVEKISLQYLNRSEDELCESNTYEAGVTLASQSVAASQQDHMVRPIKDCLRVARRTGPSPNLNSARLAIALSKIAPLRAQIEWYKALCDESDDQLGYYDSFKLRGASKRDFKILMNRVKLGEFWNNVIDMLEKNQLPHDFHKRAKWVYTSQSYKLLVEPLDIAEYYRSGDHRKRGHYLKHGRARRYEILDKWWRERDIYGENDNNSNKNRSRFASLTQDSCFWAKVEEALNWVETVKCESDPRVLTMLWADIEKFDQYAKGMVERKEVSVDVFAKNSSYMRLVEDLRVLKLQLPYFTHQISGALDRKVLP